MKQIDWKFWQRFYRLIWGDLALSHSGRPVPSGPVTGYVSHFCKFKRLALLTTVFSINLRRSIAHVKTKDKETAFVHGVLAPYAAGDFEWFAPAAEVLKPQKVICSDIAVQAEMTFLADNSDFLTDKTKLRIDKMKVTDPTIPSVPKYCQLILIWLLPRHLLIGAW